MMAASSLSMVRGQDSTRLLKRIVVSGLKQTNFYQRTVPSQSLNKQLLQQLNAPSAGDAARFFSGVQVKDYGGTGGLKTVSIRSLGAAQTGVMYDGITIADAQSGQVDLGRYSSTFLQSIDVYQANMPGTLLPARAFSSASILSINTQASQYDKPTTWQTGIRSGSFGYLDAFAGAHFEPYNGLAISATVEGVSSDGDYPVTIENGNLSGKAKRNNGSIKSLQAELNMNRKFRDSSLLQLKAWGYDSKRGLPGAIIFFNDRSVQQLWNTDYFLQGKYKKEFNQATSLQLLGKFNHNYTRYADPDFLNNSGGLDDRYRQSESYLSASLTQKLDRYISVD
ncbi:MAG: Plug domain-containing protein, partial [Chitinophagaceae bacterium]